MDNLKKRLIPSKHIRNKIKNNAFMFVLMGIGISILGHGALPPYAETMIVFGAAFIIASGVGIYMMFATGNVAKKLHERFNEQNAMLGKQTEILKEIASSQKEIASSQKEIASSQKEIASSLKSIDNKIK